jgi:hypothetical protein
MTPEEANRLRWSGGAGHYEVWYATLSDPPSQTGFWIRYTLEAPYPGHGDPYAQLWFARFDAADPTGTFGINQKLPIRELKADHAPFRVRLGDAELRHDGMRGRIAGDGHTAEWDLRWTPSSRLHLHQPDLAYHGGWAPTNVLAPNLNVAARGEITVDGRRYELAGAPLGQTHVWGKKHAYSWAWAHCNAFAGDRGVTLEAFTARLRRGPFLSPKLTFLSLVLEGSDPERVEFRDLHTLPLARSDYGTGRYQLRAVGPLYKIEAELSCRAEDMVQAEYVDPDGEPAFCHNTECADATVRLWKRTPLLGWRELRLLRADKTAHYEWGARAGDPLVKKRHVTVS